MPQDSYIQVAPDGSGKQVDMDQVATAAGAQIYRQRADLVGLSAETLLDLLAVHRAQLKVLRAILASLNSVSSSFREEDFSGQSDDAI